MLQAFESYQVEKRARALRRPRFCYLTIYNQLWDSHPISKCWGLIAAVFSGEKLQT